jgi:hypothetical protein
MVSMTPRYYRLPVDWSDYQPARNGLDLDARQGGCIRAAPPCAPYEGVREELEAVASMQARYGGFEVLVVPLFTPPWAAAPASGCEPPGTQPTARPPADLATYRAYIRALLATAREAGVQLRYWSPWNEPNHPAFLSPQRARCDTSSPALAPAAYARLARAMKAELDAAPGEQEMLVGELAGYESPRPTAASVTEFVDALPRDVVCASRIWSQHAYVGQPGAGRGADFAGDPGLDAAAGLLAGLKRSLAAKRCARPLRIWITETGVGGERAGLERSTDPAQLAAGCRAMARALRSWYADPRVDAAFQYTFRQADGFPVGLADQGLTTPFPTYDLWLAWSGNRAADAPPPPLPAACRA